MQRDNIFYKFGFLTHPIWAR